MEKGTFPEIIEGEKVVLKKHRLELAEQMFRYIDRDRERLRQFLPWVDKTKSAEDSAAFIKMSQKKWETGELFNYGIFDRETKTFMGNIGLLAVKWEHDRCEIGYWILSDFEGKGFMSSAVTALEKTCFDRGFHRVEIRCSSTNVRSAAVPRRLGYQLEGTFREDTVEQGKRRDTLIFGKLSPKSSRA